MDGGGWYVTKGDTGQRAGPVTDAGFRKALLEGQVRADDLIWCEGMAEWERAEPFLWFAAEGAPSVEPEVVAEPAEEAAPAGEPAPRPAPDASGIGRLERPEGVVAGKMLGRVISISEPDLADFCGPNAEPYLKLRQKLIDKGGKVRFTWCWPALLAPFAWLAYRKLYWMIAAVIGVNVMVSIVEYFLPAASRALWLATIGFFVFVAQIAKPMILVRADEAAEMADRLDLKGANRALFLSTQGGVSRLGGWIGGAVTGLVFLVLLAVTAKVFFGADIQGWLK